MVTEQKLEYVADTDLNDHSSSLERSSSHDLVERISFQNLNLVKIIGKGKSACNTSIRLIIQLLYYFYMT